MNVSAREVMQKTLKRRMRVRGRRKTIQADRTTDGGLSRLLAGIMGFLWPPGGFSTRRVKTRDDNRETEIQDRIAKRDRPGRRAQSKS